MTSKQFVMLADIVNSMPPENEFTEAQINALALFCAYNNKAFDRKRWLAYIATHKDRPSAKTTLDIARASRLL